MLTNALERFACDRVIAFVRGRSRVSDDVRCVRLSARTEYSVNCYHESVMRVRLRTKFVVILVVITLVLSGTVHWTLESYKRDVVDDEQQRTDETASLVAEQIDATIWEHRDRIGLVASRPEARQFDRSGPFLDAFLDNSRFYSAQLVDANGTVVDFRGSVTAGTRRSVIGSDRSGTPYVERALRGETYVSDVEYAERADRPVLVFSAPILDGSGVRGVLVGAMQAGRLS